MSNVLFTGGPKQANANSFSMSLYQAWKHWGIEMPRSLSSWNPLIWNL